MNSVLFFLAEHVKAGQAANPGQVSKHSAALGNSAEMGAQSISVATGDTAATGTSSSIVDISVVYFSSRPPIVG